MSIVALILYNDVLHGRKSARRTDKVSTANLTMFETRYVRVKKRTRPWVDAPQPLGHVIRRSRPVFQGSARLTTLGTQGQRHT